MSNGSMLTEIKNLIDSGEDFTARQYRQLMLSAMLEMGEKIEMVETGLATRKCSSLAVVENEVKILRRRNNITDLLTAVMTSVAVYLGVNK